MRSFRRFSYGGCMTIEASRSTDIDDAVQPTHIIRGPRGVLLTVAAVAVAFGVGAVTSYGQTIPGTFSWLFNSVSGWVIPMAILVLFARGGIVRSALTGAA